MGLDATPGLVRLDLANNALESVDGVAAAPALKWLNLAGNKIPSLQALKGLTNLEVGRCGDL